MNKNLTNRDKKFESDSIVKLTEVLKKKLNGDELTEDEKEAMSEIDKYCEHHGKEWLIKSL